MIVLWVKQLAALGLSISICRPNKRRTKELACRRQAMLLPSSKDNPVLVYGKIEFMTAEGHTLIYRRYEDKNEVLPFFNLEEGAIGYPLQHGTAYHNVLNDETIRGVLRLELLDAAVLVKQNKYKFHCT